MATPQQLREDVAQVSQRAVDDLRRLAGGLEPQARRALLLDLLPGLIHDYADAAGVVAVDWYDEHRAELGVRGSYTARLPALRDPGVEALLGWAESQAQTALTELDLVAGGTFRRVANGARAAIISNVAKDPRGRGFQRYARATSAGCAFCRMIAGRGAVYRSEDSATFAAHDHCQCVAVPAFDGAPVPVRPYEPSDRNISDADRARVREWLRTQ